MEEKKQTDNHYKQSYSTGHQTMNTVLLGVIAFLGGIFVVAMTAFLSDYHRERHTMHAKVDSVYWQIIQIKYEFRDIKKELRTINLDAKKNETN